MKITLDTSSVEDYRKFLRIKSLPQYRIKGREAWFPDEYAKLVTGKKPAIHKYDKWRTSKFLFDYQTDISALAIRKKKFCVFADCGLGKTLILLEFARAADSRARGRTLIVSPLMVIPQTIAEAKRWHKGLEIDKIHAAKLSEWLAGDTNRVGITNYEAIRPEVDRGNLSALILDESSMLKSHYGKWATKLIEMGRGIEYKLCCTGTPAPNDRIEYGNHAVFMDAYPTVNSFLATFFVNRGQTQERWQIKDHAVKPFYRALSHWSIFLTNPATYGWKDNCETLPPIVTHIHEVPLTREQRRALQDKTGDLFCNEAGGITKRSFLSQLAKGNIKGDPVPTNKYRYTRDLLDSWPDESTIVWCQFNDEQSNVESELDGIGGVESISGATKDDARQLAVERFKSGESRTMISKPKILGFGLNLQIATRQVFSGLSDSYESYYQAVKRSNRFGSTKPLNVHLPVTELEEPMIANVLRKAANVQRDTEEQERIFKDAGYFEF